MKLYPRDTITLADGTPIRDAEVGNPTWHKGRHPQAPSEPARPEPDPRYEVPVDPVGPRQEPVTPVEPEPVRPEPTIDDSPDRVSCDVVKSGPRLAITRALQDLRPRASSEAGQNSVDAIKKFLSYDGLHALFAMGQIESGLNPNAAANQNDGFYKEWNRQQASCGLFQIHESTAYWLTDSATLRNLAAPFQNKLPRRGPKPAETKAQNIRDISKWPEHVYLGLILAQLVSGWAVLDYSFNPARPSDNLVARNWGSAKVADYCNMVAAERGGPSNGFSPICILLRLYWAASSRKGPAWALGNGLQRTVVEGANRRVSYLDYLKSEFTGVRFCLPRPE